MTNLVYDQEVIFPIYIAMDSSGSMGKPLPDGRRPIDLALTLIDRIEDEYRRKPGMGDFIRFTLISFADEPEAKVVMGTIQDLRESKNQSSWNAEPGRRTNFSLLFDYIADTIPLDLANLEIDETIEVKRPAVFIVTDGKPSESPEAVESAWKRLVPSMITSGQSRNKIPRSTPFVVSFGVGIARAETLEKICNPSTLCFPPSDMEPLEEQIRHAVDRVISTLNEYTGGYDWLTGDDDDDDDITGLFPDDDDYA